MGIPALASEGHTLEYTESMLFINYHQPQPVKGNVLLNYSMCTYDQKGLSTSNRLCSSLLILVGAMIAA